MLRTVKHMLRAAPFCATSAALPHGSDTLQNSKLRQSCAEVRQGKVQAGRSETAPCEDGLVKMRDSSQMRHSTRARLCIPQIQWFLDCTAWTSCAKLRLP